jgi:amino acid adenylation domain-containing protein
LSAPPVPPRLAAGLAEWARATPGATAVEDPDGRRLTYAELDDAACRVAFRLREMGVRRGDRVGLCLPKGLDSVLCVMGVLKSGAAYVPVDHSAPAERNRYIFRNCETRVVCADEPRAAGLGDAGAPLLVFPGGASSEVGAPWLDSASRLEEGDEDFSEDDLAYILYTSGSTGVPKGVVHTHRSAVSFVRWAADTVRPRAEDRFGSHAPFHFDLSVLDLYVPLSAGASVVLVGDALGKEPQGLAAFIAAKRISVWYSVPSILALLAQHGRLERHDCSALRTVLFAGEVFPVKHLRALVRLWPGRAYLNLYGPTETNVCTFYRIPDVVEDDRDAPYPIGKPCSNVKAIVLDDEMRAVAPGQEGILYVHDSGPVMKGYWGDPERTAASFHVDAGGRRWYRTGDVVVEGPDGNLVYRGRRDRMVKRRGYRIELAEIEAGLYGHPNVREAAVVAGGLGGEVAITAFLATRDGERLSIIALKQFCARHLPAYMSPDRFVFLPRLPRTSTDKVDYQGLVRSQAGPAPFAGPIPEGPAP